MACARRINDTNGIKSTSCAQLLSQISGVNHRLSHEDLANVWLRAAHTTCVQVRLDQAELMTEALEPGAAGLLGSGSGDGSSLKRGPRLALAEEVPGAAKRPRRSLEQSGGAGGRGGAGSVGLPDLNTCV
eukprot:scaffold24129_cov18-Tisochrysis_lutea.AAC.1